MKRRWVSFLASISCVLGSAVARAGDVPASDADACWSFLNAGDWPRAANAGRRAVSSTPTREAHLCLGRAYKELGELDASLAELKETERLSSTDEDLRIVSNWLGLTYSNIGDLENSELYHSRALALARHQKNKPAEGVELNNLASIYSARGLYEKSLKYYRDSLASKETEDEKAPVYNNIGTVYYQSGRAREAIPWLEKAIAADERAGAYTRLAQSRLNLGDVCRATGDFARAETLLADGLAATLKVSDQYWQVIAYGYQANLKRDQKQLEAARELYAKAADLAARIGAKDLAQNNRRSYEKLLHADVARTFAGVEIGAKGVKALAIELKEPLEGGFTYTPRFRKSENTNLLAELQNGAARPAAVEATARATAGFVRTLERELGIPGKDITVLGSSAAAKLGNRDVLVERVKQLAGVDVTFVNARQEAVDDFFGAMPRDAWNTGVAIDIGSGNTKLSYSYSDQGKTNFATIEVPFGTVTLTDAVNASRKPAEDFAKALDRFVAESVRPDLVRRLKLFPVLNKRNDFYWLGGAVWAFSTLAQPTDDTTAFLPFKSEDVLKVEQRLRKDADLALNPALEAEGTAKERAQKQLSAVRSAFTNDNLLAGAKLIELLTTELHLQKKRTTFSRYGSWLLGYLYLKS